MRRVVAMLALALFACQSQGTGEVPAGSNEADALPSDPCALVTVAEVEAATGSAVEGWRIVPDEEFHGRPPPLPNPCEYLMGGKHTSIHVWVVRGGAEDFDSQQERDPINSEVVDGIGDGAYTHGLGSLYVRVGDGFFFLVSQTGAGRRGVADLKELAVAALD